MTVRIFVADDHEVVRRGICALLASHPGWEICGEAADGLDAVEKVNALKPDIVILDICMPGLNGLEITRQILRNNPHQNVAILSISDSEQVIQAVIKAGAKAYLLKSDAAKELIAAVEALQRNKTYFNRRVEEIKLRGFLDTGKRSSNGSIYSELTTRERQTLQLLAGGKSAKGVAIVLGISPKTAETHRGNLMRKLGLHSVGDVVLYAIRNNLVQVSSGDSPTPGEIGQISPSITKIFTRQVQR